jgi:pimeloyl-ACP methyl ester carboxylesterase
MITRRTLSRLLAASPLVACASTRAAAADPIDLQEFVPAGGIDQWISIRGTSSDNPGLLYLNGGPGEAQSPFLSLFAPWEQSFTVVHWDQRGSGKTYGRNRDAGGVTLEQLTADCIEIAETARERLGQQKIVLVGQSWGSLLGWRAVRERPDLFHAYVGTGMFVGWARQLPVQEDHARTRAEAAGDTAALERIAAVQTLPVTDFGRMMASRPFVMSESDLAYLTNVQGAFIGPPPPPTEGDVADWIQGGRSMVQALLPALFSYDIYAEGIEAAVPVVVIQGRDDMVTPAALAEQCVADMQAPSKEYVVIDGGHFACLTNPEGFVAALESHVLPLAR